MNDFVIRWILRLICGLFGGITYGDVCTINTSNIRFIINCICLILFGLLLGKKWDNGKEVDE